MFTRIIILIILFSSIYPVNAQTFSDECLDSLLFSKMKRWLVETGEVSVSELISLSNINNNDHLIDLDSPGIGDTILTQSSEEIDTLSLINQLYYPCGWIKHRKVIENFEFKIVWWKHNSTHSKYFFYYESNSCFHIIKSYQEKQTIMTEIFTILDLDNHEISESELNILMKTIDKTLIFNGYEPYPILKSKE